MHVGVMYCDDGSFIPCSLSAGTVQVRWFLLGKEYAAAKEAAEQTKDVGKVVNKRCQT